MECPVCGASGAYAHEVAHRDGVVYGYCPLVPYAVELGPSSAPPHEQCRIPIEEWRALRL